MSMVVASNLTCSFDYLKDQRHLVLTVVMARITLYPLDVHRQFKSKNSYIAITFWSKFKSSVNNIVQSRNYDGYCPNTLSSTICDCVYHLSIIGLLIHIPCLVFASIPASKILSFHCTLAWTCLVAIPFFQFYESTISEHAFIWKLMCCNPLADHSLHTIPLYTPFLSTVPHLGLVLGVTPVVDKGMCHCSAPIW